MIRKYAILLMAIATIISGCGNESSSADHAKDSAANEQSINDETEIEKNQKESIKKIPEKLSAEDFKAQCEELWHDDIFFTQASLDGKYIKVKVMVEETRVFSMDPNTILPEDYTKGIDLENNFLYCGVKRADEETYVGGTLTVYFTPDYNCYNKNIEAGNYLTIYGEVLCFDTETENGYNSCDIIARYVETSER